MSKLFVTLFVLCGFFHAHIAYSAVQTWTTPVIDNRTKNPKSTYRKAGHNHIFSVSASDKVGHLSPRVEATFVGGSQIRRNKGVYTFFGSFRVSKAHNTTIMQLINVDGKHQHTFVPILAVVVNEAKNTPKKWDLYATDQNGKNILLAQVPKNKSFSLQVRSDGGQVKVKINGQERLTKAFLRIGNYSTVRFGAVHSGTEGDSHVKVFKASLRRDTAAKL